MAATGREHFRWRLAATGSSRQQLVQALEAIADGTGARAEVALGQVKGRSPRPVFVMGAELYDRYAAFRKAIDRCEALYRIQRGASLKALILNPAVTPLPAAHPWVWMAPMSAQFCR
jgi:acyl transferase domain-containing protein